LSEEKIINDQVTNGDVEPIEDAAADEIIGQEQLAEEAEDEVVSLSTEELVLKLAESEKKAAEYLDGWQRSRAEFANARKRLEKQRVEAYGNASFEHVKKLLPILDDFDRALSNVPSEIEENNWFEGLRLVHRKLQSILENLDVQPIEAMGLPFDPHLHEALSLVEADGVESGVIVEELQVGFRMGEKVIRPSLVTVAA
jgi:molecular chaperone GrpE